MIIYGSELSSRLKSEMAAEVEALKKKAEESRDFRSFWSGIILPVSPMSRVKEMPAMQ